MSDIINAPITREIVSYGLTRCQDQEMQKFPTYEELYDYINAVLRQLAKFSMLLKEDLYLPIVPNQVEYNYVKIAGKLVNVVQIETVTIINADGTESKPLIYKSTRIFREQYLTNTGIMLSKYFTYDSINFAYWRPSTDATQRIKLRTSRELLNSEKVDQNTDPPYELSAKFIDYIKYGLVAEMCMARPQDQALQALLPAYQRLYDGYLAVELIPKTLQSHNQLMREF